MEEMSSQLKELWEEWQLRVLIFVSLTVQILLIVLGRHRKYRTNSWLQGLVWSLYLSADAVAIYAVGKIATRLAQLRRDLGADAAGLEPDAQMIAFWTPFLLLHLGGPDTITAYSLEDNELWKRHFLRLLIQMIMTVLIFFQALTGSELSVLSLSLLIIVSGLIKYGERVYVLRAASSEQFRDSTPDPVLHCPRVLEEYMLKQAEGYDVMPHEVIVVYEVNAEHNSEEDANLSSCDHKLLQDGKKSVCCKILKLLQDGKKSVCCKQLKLLQDGKKSDCCKELKEKHEQGGQENDSGNGSKKSSANKKAMSKRNRAELSIAKSLIDTFRRLFTDLVLTIEERDISRQKLEDKNFHVVFRVIEIELGLMYDMLYTKAMVMHNRWGFTLRSVSMLATGMVLVLLSLSDKDKYSKFNISVTFLLLSVAIFLDIYALVYLLFSDEAACWLKDNKPAILNIVEWVQPLYNRRRWSCSMGQYNLLRFALREKHPKLHTILESLHVDQKFLKFMYKEEVKVEDFVKERIFEYLKSYATSQKGDPSAWDHRGDLSLEKSEVLLDHLQWSIELEFDQSILAWHIATELLCPIPVDDYLRGVEMLKEEKGNIGLNIEMSKHLSRYMLYLLVMYPSILPIGVGRVKFRDTYLEVMNFFNEEKSMEEKGEQTKCSTNREKACKTLEKHVDPQVAPIVAKGDKSKFALYHGRRLHWQLEEAFKNEPDKKWYTVSRVWVELLAYAAVKCKGVHHAQQLRQGGEFLTHVWLLMAHFGLTGHFQIPRAPTIVELLVKRD